VVVEREVGDRAGGRSQLAAVAAPGVAGERLPAPLDVGLELVEVDDGLDLGPELGGGLEGQALDQVVDVRPAAPIAGVPAGRPFEEAEVLQLGVLVAEPAEERGLGLPQAAVVDVGIPRRRRDADGRAADRGIESHDERVLQGDELRAVVAAVRSPAADRQKRAVVEAPADAFRRPNTPVRAAFRIAPC
jgi:hypothetical protein